MAEERNPVGDPSTAETAEIRGEIERTRSEMSETIEEIQDRLRPDHLLQQAKDSVQEAAAGKVRNIMYTASEAAHMVADQTERTASQAARYIREHPVQTMLVAAGVTWWLMRDREMRWNHGSSDYPPSEYGNGGDYNSDYNSTGKIQAMRETVSEYAGQARESARQYADQARESARTAADHVRSAAYTASVKARDGWGHANDSLDRWVQENPLAVGAAAVAVGVAIGLSVPRTRYEDRTFGETRDEVLNRAKDKASEIRDRMSEQVQAAADVVTDTLGATSTSTQGATRTS